MATKSSGSAGKSSLDDFVGGNLREVRRGFLPWCDRLPPDLASEVVDFHARWVAGEFGPHARPVALLVSRWLEGRGVHVGEQGVTAWLKRRDWKPR